MSSEKSSKNIPDASSSDAPHAPAAANGAPGNAHSDASGDASPESAAPKGEGIRLEDAERMVAEACDQMLRTAARVSEAAGEATGSVREYAKNHPGSALAVSFLVGVLLGALTSRR